MDGQTRKRVCLFGTSADPPTGHGGHLGIVTHLASMEEFDEVRVLPVYSHMFEVRYSFYFD
jgi:nicotinic acid mononucleotide adenylyltransferase